MNLSGNTDLIIASGRDYADALSASSTGAAVMLAGNELTNEQLEFIKNVSEDVKIYIAGGTSAVSEYIESQLEKNGIEIADRFDGANRYETSVRIAEVFFKKPEAVYIVSGDDFPDGITGGVLANADNAPLILVNERNTALASDFVGEKSVKNVIAVGGTAVITDAMLKSVAGR